MKTMLTDRYKDDQECNVSPQYIDAIELTIQMSKGEGNMPDLSNKKSSEIKKMFSLLVNGNVLKDIGYTHYRVVKSGEKSDTLAIAAGSISGFPTLKVRIYRYPDFRGNKADVFRSERALAGSAFMYKISDGVNEYIYLDANGLTEALRLNNEMKSPEFFDEKLREKCTEL